MTREWTREELDWRPPDPSRRENETPMDPRWVWGIWIAVVLFLVGMTWVVVLGVNERQAEWARYEAWTEKCEAAEGMVVQQYREADICVTGAVILDVYE